MNKFLNNSIKFLLVIGLLIIATGLFFIHSKPIFINGIDSIRIVFHQNHFLYLCSLFIIIVLFFILSKNKIRNLKLIFLTSLILKIIVVFIFPVNYYYDMGFYLKDVAAKMVDSFSLNYGFNILTHYYYNIPLVYLYTLYIKIMGLKNAYFLGYAVNIIALIMIEVNIYKISKLVFNEEIAEFALKLSLCFTPFYAFLPIVYNDVIGTSLCVFALYYFVKYLKYTQIKHIIIYFVLITIAIIFRNVSSIFLLASVFYLIINNFKKSIVLILISLMIILTFNNTKFYDKVYDKLGVYNASGASHASILNYIAIGISRGVDNEAPGYFYPFDSYILDYLNDDYTVRIDEFNHMLIKYIKSRINELGFSGFIKHYFAKFILTYSDGTFEGSLFLNLLPNKKDSAMSYYYENNIHKLITNNSIIYENINNYSRAFWHIILISVIFALIKNKDKIITLFSLIILGIMAFYLILETSPHYIFIALPIFIILASYGFFELKMLYFRNKKHKI